MTTLRVAAIGMIAGWMLTLWMATGAGRLAAETIADSPAPLTVAVSVHPLARVVNSVARSPAIKVETLLSPGATPHDAALRPRQLEQLVKADLVVWMGPEVEPYLAQWLQKRSGPTLDISTLPGIVKLPMAAHSDEEHGHTHNAHFDVHLWWSRQNLSLAANAVADRLLALAPALQSGISRQREQFMQDMALLEKAWPASANKLPSFAVFHDGWQYLEHDLGQSADAGFVLDGELSMGVKHLAELQQRFQSRQVECVLLEPGMNTSLVRKLLPSTPTVTLDPLGWDAPGDGVIDLLQHAYQTLKNCQNS